MDFINKNRKKIRTVLLVILTLAIFSLSYYVCISRLKSTNIKGIGYEKNNNANNEMTVHSNVDVTASPNATAVFKVKYIKSGELVTEKEENVGDLAGKKKNELDQIYKDKGYSVQNINPSQIVFVKELNKYAPNKYVLGIKNGYIAIYKTDKEGNMFIENDSDITEIKIDRLKPGDIQLLTKGDKYFQCNTKEDAEARLEDYE